MSTGRDRDDRDAFIKACADWDTRRVRRLLDRGADVEQTRQETWSPPTKFLPLWVAVLNDRHDTVRLLLERGADINHNHTFETTEWRINPPPNPMNLRAEVAVTREMGTPLIKVCAYLNQSEMAQLLIEYGADVNFATSTGHTALHAAARYPSLVRLLLKNGARPNDTYGRLLLEHGASPHRVSPGPPPLFSACGGGTVDGVRLLLDYGADPNVAGTWDWNPDCDTCLYVACFNQAGRNYPIVPTVAKARLLLGRGARVDPKTWLRLCVRAPMQYQWTVIGGEQTRSNVPSSAEPLRKLFLKHYSILV